LISLTGGFRLIVFIFLCSIGAVAQTTTVTGPIIDPSGNTWSVATVHAVFVPTPNVPGPYVWSGGAFNANPPTVTTDAGGNFTLTLPSNTSITPSGSSWQIITGPNATTSAAIASVMLSGGSLDISTAYTAVGGWPTTRINPTPITTVYNTNQTLPPPTGQGGMVYNTTTQQMEIYTISGWVTFANVGGLPVVTNPTGNQIIVQPLGSSLDVNSLNAIIYAQSGQNINTLCANFSGAQGTIIVPVIINVTSNTTLPANCYIQMANGGSFNISAGTNLTINGPFMAGIYDVFFGSTSNNVTFGVLQAEVPVEWFGAIGDWNGSTGTDNTISIQKCINSLTRGLCRLQSVAYKISSPISITKSQVGIVGVSAGFPSPTLYPNPSPSEIITTSSTADVIDLAGTSSGNTISFDTFKDFTIARSVIPADPSRGLSMIFADGTVVDGVTSEDSFGCFYIHGMAGQGSGHIENSIAIWGYNGFTETSGQLGGFVIDSVDGTTNNSLRIRHSGAFSALSASGPVTYGIQSAGAATHDLFVDDFETATLNYGDYIFSSTLGFTASSDIHFSHVVNDGCYISCIYIDSVGGTIEFNGGWNYRQSASTPVIDIEASNHVKIIGQQLYYPAGTGVGIYTNGGGSIEVLGNDFGVGSGSAVSFNDTGASIISSNIANSITATNIISLVGSQANVISDNVLNGTATNGIYLDSASTVIVGLETNQIGFLSLGSVTNRINDNTSPINATIVPSLIDTQITITPSASPICPNGINGAFTIVGCSGGAANPIVGTPTAGQAACIKAAGPPVLIGYCSTVVGTTGACTCN
jgi:hypothetical protein